MAFEEIKREMRELKDRIDKEMPLTCPYCHKAMGIMENVCSNCGKRQGKLVYDKES